MAQWKEQLKNIANTINDFIANDRFPEKIEPAILREAVRAYPMLGGKRLRPALVMWSCGLFGGKPESALPAAAAVEIYHNWTLVHDDIIDCDDFRRGTPTTHISIARSAETEYGAKGTAAAKFGTDFAILAGDLQQSWSVEMLCKLQDNGYCAGTVLYLIRKMQENLGRELISGEACDVAFEIRNDEIPECEVRKMISGKTGALFRYCVQTGAVLANPELDFEHTDVKAIAEFAECLALAFQLRDDWLGIFGDVEKFGKPIGSDFQEGKPTLLYLAAMKNGNPDQQKKMQSLLRLENYTPEIVEEIRALLRETGAEKTVLDEIESCSKRAVELLSRFEKNAYRDLLEELTGALTGRNV